jgi:hypothetical protein
MFQFNIKATDLVDHLDERIKMRRRERRRGKKENFPQPAPSLCRPPAKI